MTEVNRRRIRIECDPKMPVGHAVKITDADTGKDIFPGAFKAEVHVHLNATEMNTADITYWETNEQGALVAGPDDQPIEHTETVECAELDVTAFAYLPEVIANGHS